MIGLTSFKRPPSMRELDSTQSGGFSLVEVLVAILITVIGLLGMLTLQARAQQAELEAYQRSQAMLLVDEMVNRIRANIDALGCYDITDEASGTPYLGTGSAIAIGCAGSGSAETRLIADADLTAWHNTLIGAGESMTISGTPTQVGGLVGARGCISQAAGADIYTISVTWQGQYALFTPDADLNCATGEYNDDGNDDQRRIVSVTIEFSNLAI